MENFEWDPSLETGIPEVDEQHRALFALAEDLHAAIEVHSDPEVVENAVYALSEYVTQHFADEERLMGRTGFPGLEPHQKMHHDLTAETLRIATRYFHGEDVLPEELGPFLTSWLKEHIGQEDKLLAAHIRAQDRAGF